MKNEKRDGVSRREFVRAGLTAAAIVPGAGAAWAGALTGCGSGEGGEGGTQAGSSATPPAQAPAQPAKPPTQMAQAEAPKPAAPPAGGDAQLVTEVPAMKPMVDALQYVHQSAKPDQHCSNCQLFTATSGGRGKCQLFQQGLVEETGWCSSWTAKVT